jgi:ATP/maltotriose-dependent transcriptional regulator MalT
MAQPSEQLVGRAAELALLDAALAELERGCFVGLEIAGEPGIGKTRLLAELGARADRRGHVVLSGSASELDRELPFWTFIDALDDCLHALEPRRLRAVDEDARAELAHVFPSLGPTDSDGPQPADHRLRTHRAVRHLLETLAAAKPLVLLLDDVHWADSGSIELLGSLLRRPPAAPVAIAVAVRPRQRPERLAAALERARVPGTMTRLELAALSADEAGELLGAAVGGARAAALYEESGGNPFYLQQLARSPQRATTEARGGSVALAGVEVPRAVAAALSDELALLPEDVRRLLEGAAVAGDPFEPELATAAAALPEATALDALDELLRRDLVRPTEVPRRFRFRHPLVRGAVYEAAPGGWRLGAHERSAALLAARGAPPIERAHHVERCARHGDTTAVAVLREAGDAALQRAPATAAKLYRAALRLLGPEAEPRGLLAALSGAHTAAGQFREAYDATVESLELLPDDGSPARIRLTAECAGLEHMLGRHDAAHQRLLTCVERTAAESSPDLVVLLLLLAIDGFYRLEYPAMRQWSVRALDAGRPVGDRALIAATTAGAAIACVCNGAIAEAETRLAEAAALTDQLGDDEFARWMRYSTGSLVATELWLGRHADAAAHAERGLAVARAHGRGQDVPVLFWAGTVRTVVGRLQAAAEVFDTAIEIARLAGHDTGLAWNLQGRSLAATAAGDVETALATAEESVDVLGSQPPVIHSVWARYALAAARLPAGDAAGAAEMLLSAGRGDALSRFPATWRPGGYELLTRCRLAVGRREEAARAAGRARACADALGLPMADAMAERAAAAVALDAGDGAGAAVLALASAERAEAAGAVLEAAQARALAGRALVAAGDPRRAAAELERAAARFDACGAVRRRDAMERELRRLGRRDLHRRTRAAKLDGAGIDSLTERELQVARLIVDRRTNAQIAAELFLSQKTVETHVRNLFHKLDVSSRVEVARAIERAERELSAR